MTDKELLELAAKAIEINIRTDFFGRIYLVTSDENGEIHGDWNPLTDDGDRYRLAKELNIEINFRECFVAYFCKSTNSDRIIE